MEKICRDSLWSMRGWMAKGMTALRTRWHTCHAVGCLSISKIWLFGMLAMHVHMRREKHPPRHGYQTSRATSFTLVTSGLLISNYICRSRRRTRHRPNVWLGRVVMIKRECLGLPGQVIQAEHCCMIGGLKVACSILDSIICLVELGSFRYITSEPFR